MVDSPVANAGGNQDVTEGATVTLDGSASTGRNLIYAWTPASGTGWVLSDATAQSPTFTAPDVAAGGETLTFQLTVTDDVGATSTSAPVNVNVADASVSPVADAGPDQTVALGASVTLDGTGSTGSITSYDWIQTDGTLVQLAGANTATPTFTAPNVRETLVFQLTVNGGSTDTTSVTVGRSGGGGGGGGGGCFINSMF